MNIIGGRQHGYKAECRQLQYAGIGLKCVGKINVLSLLIQRYLLHIVYIPVWGDTIESESVTQDAKNLKSDSVGILHTCKSKLYTEIQHDTNNTLLLVSFFPSLNICI